MSVNMMRYFFVGLLLSVSLSVSSQKYFLFIGTYTGTGSKGIYVYTFDASTGKAKWVSNTEGVVNPSYLAIAPGGKLLYACTETRTADAGGVSAFSFDRKKGNLTFLNKQSSGGDNPAYVSVHQTGKWVVAGNYSGGNLAAFPIIPDGNLQPLSQLVQHTGTGKNKQRQEQAHVHATVFSPTGDYLFVPDLGIDKVMIYKFNPSLQHPLRSASPAFVSTNPGSGPRHFVFHPNNKWAYLMEEMAGEVSAYRYKKGRLELLQRIPAHPDTSKGEFGSADIHVSPDGEFLYASNRGNENNIAIFSIDKNGKLSRVGYQSTMGIQPRNFVIDPSGKYLLAANQKTGNIVIFKRDMATGLLQFTGEQINIPQPVCLKMIR
ncbi:MAG TPA: lactonase family protein [Chitinophagaceae bacterium]|nr:lactonase family protein [Chitinophagaceae bacterium]